MERQSKWLWVAATIALAFTAATIEIGGGVARGESVWYNMRRKEKQIWQQNADIVVRRATGTDARTVQTGFTSTVTTRSTVNGAALQVTDTGVRMVQTGFTGMVRVATSASGVDRPQTARVVHTLLRAAMKSNDCGHIAEQRTDDWQPLIARLENDLPSAGESLQIIWP